MRKTAKNELQYSEEKHCICINTDEAAWIKGKKKTINANAMTPLQDMCRKSMLWTDQISKFPKCI